MEKFFIKASLMLGDKLAPDHIKLAFTILSTYPCALLFKRIQTDWIKHVFSIVYSTLVMVFILKLYHGFAHIMVISMISFLLLKFYKGENVAWINFVFVMASMSFCHIDRQINGIEGDTKLDYSGALMILTIKLSSFGFNIKDGPMKNLSFHDEQMKITKYPTCIQYFGWLLYFPGFLAGPTCEYMDYIRLVESKRISPLNESIPAFKKFAKSLIFITLIIYLGPTFNYSEALRPEWSNHSFGYKVLFLQLCGMLTRCKYYGVWFLAEGACILSGFGFNGYDKDGKALWNKLTNANVVGCELAQSNKVLAENWNIGANHWLRHYVYLRFNSSGSSNGNATMKTYVISSLWHGFHPGFYCK